jgi:cytochrome c oxidase subunit 1/cytochrome c oxidase subunit I+III
VSSAKIASGSLPVSEELEVRGKDLFGWFSTVEHKRIGMMYIVLAFFYFCVGGIEAILMRIQLAWPNNHFLDADTYNQTFTMHGTTMIFLVVVPLMLGFSVYFVPLMIGATDIAFPRLNSFGFWVLLFGSLLLYYSYFAGGAPAAGWFSYTPLSEKPYSLHHGIDYWALSLLAIGTGSIATSLNLIVTIITMRAPGLDIRRLPLFVWMVLVNSHLIIFAFPALNASLVALLFDRELHAHFFGAYGGGSPILWQHFFWNFGHPEVYIMILPAWGIISEVIPVFSRKPIFGYPYVAASTVAIGLLSFGVWAHHMFAVGLGHPWDLAMAATSMLIAVPTGVKIFNWIATMWNGAIHFTTSMLFAIAFLIQFTMGGLSGVLFAFVPIDWKLTDTYFVVAHFHYVLFGGTIFAVFSGVYYWFPKMTGRMLSEKLGRIHFWLMVIGFNATFLVQHIVGIAGMPRRVYTYPDLPGWAFMNQISSMGVAILSIGVFFFFWNILSSARRGEPAGDNPWDAWSLEWATTSPPPPYNFDKVPPIRSRRPVWDLNHPEDPDWRKPGAA